MTRRTLPLAGLPWAALALLASSPAAAAPPAVGPGLAATAPLSAPAASAAPAPAAAPTGPERVIVDLDVADDRDRLGWAAPDYAKLQTGGFLGMFTVGLGYSAWRDRINVGLTYGYTPRLKEAPPVQAGSLTVSLRPLRTAIGPSRLFYFYPLYIGGGAALISGKNTFVQQPDVYPAGYYAPNAFHLVALVGSEFAVREREGRLLLRHSLYVEAVTINQYLDALRQNREFTLIDAFSTAIGYRASF